MGKKRKNTRSKESGPAKRLKSSTFGQDSEDDTSDSDMDVDDAREGQKSAEEEQEKEDTQHDDGIEDEPEEEVTVKVLDAKIDDTHKSIKAAFQELDNARKAQMKIKDTLDDLMRKEMEARREQSTFCSLKRSEVRLVTLVVLQSIFSWRQQSEVFPQCFKGRFPCRA